MELKFEPLEVLDFGLEQMDSKELKKMLQKHNNKRADKDKIFKIKKAKLKSFRA